MNMCFHCERISVHVNMPEPSDGSQLNTRVSEFLAQTSARFIKSDLITEPVPENPNQQTQWHTVS